jgi:hypothetical protein
VSNWLNKFRDDPSDPRWLDKFPDDPRKKTPHPPVPGERPQSILLFAALMSASLVLGLTATGIAYPRLARFVTPVEILLPDVMVIAIIGAFVYLVAGLRQRWAVWLLALFCVVRFVLYVPTFVHLEPVTLQVLTTFYFILQAAAFWFVFTPPSRRWLAQKPAKQITPGRKS